MTQYATSAQFTAVYSLKDITTGQIDTFLERASNHLNSRLGGTFSTPFSSNNLTARDLAIDIAMYNLRVRSLAPGDSAEIKTFIDDQINALIEGSAVMATSSGDAIIASTPGREVWSSRQSYKPVFDMRDSIFQRVDPDLEEALDAQDD